jgi:DNA-directed RNA polymerase subunit RPC12/RpoP
MLIITDNLPRGAGWLEVDNRASAGGYFEADTYTCTHCGAVVVMNPLRKRERYKCNGCSHHICDDCAAKRLAGEPCKTLAQKIDEFFTAQARQAVADLPNHPAAT